MTPTERLNAALAETEAEIAGTTFTVTRGGARAGAGRKPNAEPSIVKSIRLTEAEWAKLAALGGADWIRLKLRMARLP